MNPLTAWRQWLTASDLSPQTIRLRTYQMRRFADHHPNLLGVKTAHLTQWLARPEWSTETRRSQLAALRSFYGWAYASGLTTSDPSRLLARIRSTRQRVRHPAPEGAIQIALATSDSRTQLMILLGYREALRRGEIAVVHSDDLIEDLAGWSLLVHGKGRRDRIIPLADDIAARLRSLPPGWAFPGKVDGHLSAGHVGVLLSRALPAHWTGHTLRHRWATTAYARTGDIRAVQEVLGHASVATTQIYVEIPDDALRAAVNAAA